MAEVGAKSLDVTVHRAQGLENVEFFGRQDPYVRLFLGLHDPDKCTKTTVAKRAGTSPVWEEMLTLEHLKEDSHILYVEIMDEEKVGDRIIAFTAIPLSQVRESSGNLFTGNFDVYSRGGEVHGTLDMTLCIRDRHEPAHSHTLEDGHAPKGTTTIIAEHKKRVLDHLVHKKHVGHPMAAAAGEAIVGFATKVIGIQTSIDKAKHDHEAKKPVVTQVVVAEAAVVREI